MTSTTPNGYPYPDGTDQVADGDNAIQALAEAVDTQLGTQAAGRISVNVTNGGTAASAAVTFPADLFTVAPVVLVTRDGVANTSVATAAGNTTATGTTISAVRATAGPVNTFWHAVQI